MLTWEQFVRDRLSLQGIEAEREERIVAELAQQLEEFYREARTRGASEAEAEAYVLEQVKDWTCFESDIRRVERRNTGSVVDRWAERSARMDRRKGEWEMIWSDLLQDVAYGTRLLRRSPGFTAVAVLTIALGIGANTAMFSIVNGVLLRPLPYPQPERLVQVTTLWKGYGTGDISEPEYFDLLDRSKSFEVLGMHDSPRMQSRGVDLVGGPDGPERIPAVRITPSAMEALGVQPLLGRLFLRAEGTPAGERVVLLSYAFWQRRFGGDSAAVGSVLRLGETPHRIVGVMPGEFAYPNRTTEIWLPYRIDRADLDGRGSHYNFLIGRLKAGVAEDQAQAELENISRDLRTELGGYFLENEFRFGVRGYMDVVTGEVRPALLLLLGAVGFVLLIACANVANLLLARITGRESELAIRAALGAGPGRVVRQLLTESLLLSIFGGAGALLLAGLALRTLVALQPAGLPRVHEIQIDTAVLAFNALLALATGAAFGLIPARKIFVLDLQSRLKPGSRVYGSAGSDRFRSLLVVAEVALATVLLVGAALLLQSLYQVLAVEPGFRTDHILTARVSLDASRYPERSQGARFYQDLMEELQARPGVVAAGGISALPLSGIVEDRALRPDESGLPVEGTLQTQYRAVTPDYFRTMEIPLLQGRAFTDADRLGSQMVTILSESVARKFWGNENPVGRRITPGDDQWLTVVGVVSDVRQAGLTREVPPIFYRPVYQVPWYQLSLVARTEDDPARALPLVRDAVLKIDPLQPVYEVRLMKHLVSESSAQERLNTLLLTAFAALALGLAMVGVYSVISYSVGQRTHEIGVRVALGAERRHVYGLIFGQGFRGAGVGIALGLVGALGLARTLEGLLFQVSPSEPMSYAVVTLALAAATLLACYVPARRATRVDPMVALRYE